MAANTARRKLECDCGYMALGEDDDELVAAVQSHAYQAHGMKLSAELVLDLADTQNATMVATVADRGTVPDVEPEETAVSQETERIR